ncbi:RNA polymerase sigma factor SigM [mine drainage metagenome]|uniref:RNA polymerase sigma factor SigM n=1 Tax=mine drainage metagenome TaxID=410659 RepID=A0A1J5RYY6_9ZZZZ
MDQESKIANPKNWLTLYGDLLYNYTLMRVNDQAIAEDLVQETFLSALKAIDTYKGIASEKNWLFAILKNKIIDFYRKRATELTRTEMPDLQNADDDWFNAEGSWNEKGMPNDWSVSENLIERKEVQKIIDWCRNNLKELQQNVFTLKYMEDLNSDEICKVLNISPSNYWTIIHRARLQMRSCVEKHWVKS